METKSRKTIFDSLKTYDYMCNDENAYIEITEWTNTEGYDIHISNDRVEKHISLSEGELEAIDYLIKHLRYNAN